MVICVHDVTSIYRVPLLLETQGVVSYLSRRLNMPIETKSRTMLTKWKEMSDRSDRLLEHCSIALVGKYTKFSDSYASVIKALEHSALAISHRLEVKSLVGILVPGGFGVRGTEGKIHAINWARKQRKPFLGKLYGDKEYVEERHRHRFEITHILLECSTTQSSRLAPSSHHPHIWACCWQLQGSYRAIYRKAAGCPHGKHSSAHLHFYSGCSLNVLLSLTGICTATKVAAAPQILKWQT
ncbi:hypothetical protein GOODEAATRI_019343 [Goodea atripinnis]|uniref:CTP synthase (glutamine hydrolyzing) n=1 Tax=Goodea atripinnis TaxID=208336 RepID=A0ABV0P669_9TELE